MDAMANPPAASNSTADALETRSWFGKVLTTTPVVLTIVATFLVSQSSSEMTQAQYHRATASQNQSKVGDQWAFFQAKRIRGTSYEVTSELLSALRDAEPFTRETLPAAADALARETAAATTSADKLVQALGKDKNPGEAGKLTQQVSALKEV